MDSPTPEACRALLQNVALDARVIAHCEAVAALASRVARAIETRGTPVRVRLVECGALLHDIGRSQSHGLDHALLGARLLRVRGYPEDLALCVERHTGGGLDVDDARALGLPPADYSPRSLEEKLVCQIDNLFDGTRRQTHLEEVRYLESRGLAKAARKVEALHHELSQVLGADLDRFT